MPTDVTHHMVEANGIRMHIAEQGTGPTVLLCHGFPELWCSWRHQLSALAAAGFHVVAPDMRGYGQTDAPQQIDRYTLLHAVGDMVGLLDALGIELCERQPNVRFCGYDHAARKIQLSLSPPLNPVSGLRAGSRKMGNYCIPIVSYLTLDNLLSG
jgi:hypothetical protein